MKTWVAILLAVCGLAAVGVAYTYAAGHHAFDGCRVEIASEATHDVAWSLEFRGKTRTGSVAAPST